MFCLASREVNHPLWNQTRKKRRSLESIALSHSGASGKNCRISTLPKTLQTENKKNCEQRVMFSVHARRALFNYLQNHWSEGKKGSKPRVGPNKETNPKPWKIQKTKIKPKTPQIHREIPERRQRLPRHTCLAPLPVALYTQVTGMLGQTAKLQTYLKVKFMHSNIYLYEWCHIQHIVGSSLDTWIVVSDDLCSLNQC